MEEAPTEAPPAAAPAAGHVEIDGEKLTPEQAAERLRKFVRCRRGARANNYCNGTGVVVAIINKTRTKVLCPCIEAGIKAAEAQKAAADKASKEVFDLAARAEGLEPPPPPPEPEVPRGARERLATLERELAREVERHERLEVAGGVEAATLEGRLAAARDRAAADLRTIYNEETDHDRMMVEAQGAKKLATDEIERLRARVEELRGLLHDADATIERLTNQAGQYSARRMTVNSQLETDVKKMESQIAAARAAIGPNLKRSGDRVESLRYRIEQLRSRHPGLRSRPS